LPDTVFHSSPPSTPRPSSVQNDSAGDPPLSHRPASSHSVQELPDTYSRTPDRNSPPLPRT
jgi:hypothetical protein